MLNGWEVRSYMIIPCTRVVAKQHACDKSMKGQDLASQFYKNVVCYLLFTVLSIVFTSVTNSNVLLY